MVHLGQMQSCMGALYFLTPDVKVYGAFGDRAPAKVHKHAPPQALEYDDEQRIPQGPEAHGKAGDGDNATRKIPHSPGFRGKPLTYCYC